SGRAPDALAGIVELEDLPTPAMPENLGALHAIRLENVVKRNLEHLGNLARIRGNGKALANQCDDRRDAKSRDRVKAIEEPQGRDESGVDAGFFPGFTQGRCDRITVPGFHRPTGKTHL